MILYLNIFQIFLNFLKVGASKMPTTVHICSISLFSSFFPIYELHEVNDNIFDSQSHFKIQINLCSYGSPVKIYFLYLLIYRNNTILLEFII